MQNETLFEVTTLNSFVETVEKIKEQTEANGFRVLHIHDVKATLEEKGFEIHPLKIIEVCNAKYAYTALQIDVTVSLLMPCRINVYDKGEEVIISTVRPTQLVEMFNNSSLKSFSEDIESALTKIIEESK